LADPSTYLAPSTKPNSKSNCSQNLNTFASLLLLRSAERKLGVCGRLADAMPDRRDASRIRHLGPVDGRQDAVRPSVAAAPREHMLVYRRN
jgi:hypothetical protein